MSRDRLIMRVRKNPVLIAATRELDAAGVPWRLERLSKHAAIIAEIDGEERVFPFASQPRHRQSGFTLANVRRALRASGQECLAAKPAPTPSHPNRS